MEEIGKVLKEQREALGLSIDDVSEKTRLTSKHIKALEEGDLSFFRDDLSYLRFFVKSYCEVVGLNFDDMKEDLRKDIKEYTTSFAKDTELSHQEIERNVANSEKLSNVKNKAKEKKKRFKKKPDISLVSLLVIIGVVALVILLAFIMFMQSSKQADNISDNRPVAPAQDTQENTSDETTENSDLTEEEADSEEEEKELEISEGQDATHFTLNNLKVGDTLTVETTLTASSSGYSVTILDGTSTTTKDDGIYSLGETITTEITIKEGMKFNVYIGCILQTEITINGKTVKLDETVNPTVSTGVCQSATIEFTVGETYESSE